MKNLWAVVVKGTDLVTIDVMPYRLYVFETKAGALASIKETEKQDTRLIGKYEVAKFQRVK